MGAVAIPEFVSSKPLKIDLHLRSNHFNGTASLVDSMIDHLSGSKCHHVLAKACKLRSHAFSLFATFRVKLLQKHSVSKQLKVVCLADW